MADESKGERRCRSFAGWIPVLLVGALIAFSYYAYVVQLCIFTLSNIPQKVIYLVIFHVLLLLMLWSFYAVLSARPSLVPPQFFLTHSELRQYEEERTEVGRIQLILDKSKSLPVHCRTANGDIRFCQLCKCIKPDRAHHCSSCERCILKMDHHCVWVNGCVCFDNYKFFVLLVAYSCLYCFFITVTLLIYFITFLNLFGIEGMKSGDVVLMIQFCISIAICISLTCLLVFHWHLIRHNRTTMEHSYSIPVFVNGPDKFGFHHGTYANFVDVFGERRLCWFLPVPNGSVGDGVTYARNLLSESMSKHESVSSSQLSLTSTPTIKTSLRLVQPVSKSNSDSDVAEEDALLNGSERRRKSHSGIPVVTPVKQQQFM